MSKKIKIFVIVVLILAGIIFAVSFFSGEKIPANNNNDSPISSTTGIVPLPGIDNSKTKISSDEFSSLLSSIKSITIDTKLFENPAYKMLRDFPVTLGSDVIGRSNPFIPIGNDTRDSSTQDVFVDTLQSGKVTSTTAEFGAQLTLLDTVPTNIVFEYGTSDEFGNATAPITISKNGTVLVTVTKLLPDTTYYVRAVAARGADLITGNMTTFITTKK
jgi:hypothetical protein